MQRGVSRGRVIGIPLEFTVSEVINKSIDDLIDAGPRFNIINDDKADEEVCSYGNDTGDTEVH